MDLYVKILIGALIPFLGLVGFSLFRFMRLQAELKKREKVTLSPQVIGDLLQKASREYANELDLGDGLDRLIEHLIDTISFTSASYMIPVVEGSTDYDFKIHLVYEVSKQFIQQNKDCLTEFIESNFKISPDRISEDVEGGPVTSSSEITVQSRVVFPLEVGNIKGAICLTSRKRNHFSEFLTEDLRKLFAEISGGLGMLWEVAHREHGKFKAMVDSMRDGVFMVDADYRFLIANPVLKRMLGLYEAETVNIVRVSSFFACTLSIEDVISEVFALGKTKSIEGIKIKEKILDLIAIPVKVRSDVVGVVCLVQDVTKEQELEEMRRDFSAMIIHELRSPLSVIRGTSDFLLKESENLEAAQKVGFIEQIRKSSDTLLDLVNNLLDSAKIESGNVELFKEPTDLNALIKEEVDYYTKSAEQKELALKVSVDSSVDRLDVDPGKLRQVLNNLLSNALKYTEPGGTVLLSTKKHADLVRIIVSDTGKGIADSNKKTIFEKYKQMSGSSSEKSTGLGLAIAKGIVEAHGGRIWVEDNDPQGSRFIVELPA